MTRSALGASLLILSTQLIIPLGSIPLTLQTLVLKLLAFCLPPHQGTRAVVLYLTLGLIGFPVFSKGGAGIGHLAGPTGGYLIGFLIATYWIQAWQFWFLKDRGFRGLGLFLHTAVVLLLGAVWMVVGTGMEVHAVIGITGGLLFPACFKIGLAFVFIEAMLRHRNKVK